MKKCLFFLGLLSLPLLSLAETMRIPLSPDLALLIGSGPGYQMGVMVICKYQPIKQFTLTGSNPRKSIDTTECSGNNIISGEVIYEPIPFQDLIHLQLKYKSNNVMETMNKTTALPQSNYSP